MITTLEEFKDAAIELCNKYGLSNDCYVSMNYKLNQSKVRFSFSHYEINLYQPFEHQAPEEVLRTVEVEMKKLSDPLGKAKIHLENLNKELLAAGKKPLRLE